MLITSGLRRRDTNGSRVLQNLPDVSQQVLQQPNNQLVKTERRATTPSNLGLKPLSVTR